MINFDILDRFTGKVNYTAEIDCDESESYSIKLGLAVKRGIKNKKNLSYSDLSGSNLRGSNLRGSNFSFCVGGISDFVKFICLDRYQIIYTSDRIFIGCESHSIEDWMSFSDSRISGMDDGALKFWKKYKNFIFTAIELSPASPAK